MAIGSDTLILLKWLKQSGYLPPRPAVIELGAQQLANTFLRSGTAIDALGRIFGCHRPFEMRQPAPAPMGDGGAELLDPAAPFARDFWIWLGFEYAATPNGHESEKVESQKKFSPARLCRKCLPE